MKKLFGIVSLFFCVFLASCGFNNLSGKTGSLEFSIPESAIIKLGSQYSARSIDADLEDTEFVFLVQVKGSKNYYACQQSSLGYTKEKLEEIFEEMHENKNPQSDDTRPASGSNAADYNNEEFSEELKYLFREKIGDVKFEFKNLPVNQTYTVMFDLLVKPMPDDSYDYSAFISEMDPQARLLYSLMNNIAEPFFTGITEDVVVEEGVITPVIVKAKAMQEDNPYVDVKIDFEGNSQSILLSNEKEYENDEDFEIQKKSGALYYQDKKIKDISYVLKDGFNLADSPIKYTLYYMGYTVSVSGGNYNYVGDNLISARDLKFKNNTCSIKDLLLSLDIFESTECFVKMSVGDFFVTYMSPRIAMYYDPNSIINSGETFDEEVSGEISISSNKLSFEKHSKTTDAVRYMTTIPISSILGDKHLAEGDTVVFTLKTTDEQKDDIFYRYSVDRFYYQLQIDDWENFDDTELFKNNNCINFDINDTGKYTFVMPLNLIEDPENYRNLQLFFDCPKGTDVESIDLNCMIQYHIFPESMAAYAFAVQTDWNNGIRYEINVPLRLYGSDTPLDLQEKDHVYVILGGDIYKYSSGMPSPLPAGTLFTTELYDNAFYDGGSFHALSVDSIPDPFGEPGDYIPNTGNIKTLAIDENGYFEDSGIFVYAEIAAPHVDSSDPYFVNNFKFQCHTPCENPDEFIVILGYSFTAYNYSSSGN